MAEALVRRRCGGRIEAFSAGLTAGGVDVLAVAAMAEIGIDISGACAKSLEALDDQAFDYVVTLGRRAQNECPAFADGTRILHWDVDPPDVGPTVAATDPAGLEPYRRVRGRIAELVDVLPQSLQQAGAPPGPKTSDSTALTTPPAEPT